MYRWASPGSFGVAVDMVVAVEGIAVVAAVVVVGAAAVSARMAEVSQGWVRKIRVGWVVLASVDMVGQVFLLAVLGCSILALPCDVCFED